MESLDNAFSFEDLGAWYARLGRDGVEAPALLCELKVDGLAINLLYEQGRLVRALTRGDGRKNEWTAKEVDEQLTKAFGDKASDIAAEFKQAFPKKKVQDVIYYAGASRPGVKNLLNRATEKSKVPVYNYVFAWEYPINGGITSFHCSELAFCFHALSVPQIKTPTGGGPVAMALQDKVATAWINFAKTGNPSQPGLEWKPYTKDGQQAMVFDTVSQ